MSFYSSHSRPTSTFKRLSITQLYLSRTLPYETTSDDILLGTSLVDDTQSILEEQPLLYSASVSTTSPFLKSNKSHNRSVIDTSQKQDNADTPMIPVISDQVQYQLTGTSSDES